jgi:hypothetical protein
MPIETQGFSIYSGAWILTAARFLPDLLAERPSGLA